MTCTELPVIDLGQPQLGEETDQMPVPLPALFQDQCIGAANAGNVILAPAAQLFEIMSGGRMGPPGRRCRRSACIIEKRRSRR
jgi:hypothetical protein